MSDRYDIVRFFLRGRKRVILRNVTLADAQAFCKHPNASSTTTTTAVGQRRTRLHGPWFDGYRSSTAANKEQSS